jgi:CubicO group peptidase (beta-lactamase class C family)
MFLISSTFLFGASFDFSPLDFLMVKAIKEKVFPGGVVLINYGGKTIYHKPFGRYTYDKTSPKITRDTLFDIASLTKAIATTTLAMQLHDKNLLAIDCPVSEYFGEFATPDKKDICIKHLLTHTSGLIDKPIRSNKGSSTDLVKEMLNYRPRFLPGSSYNYMCCNMIFVHAIIEQITGMSFEECFNRLVKQPLGLGSTCFRPKNVSKCAPTGDHQGRGKIIQGVVHDDRAFILGGAAGNAGLFSTASDLEKFMLMMMNEGKIIKNNKPHQFIKPETIKSWTSQQCDFKRGYGWEIGRHLSDTSFGHFGWTGVSIWADRDLDLFVILLTNRTFPDDKNLAIREFRIEFHDLIMKIMFGK